MDAFKQQKQCITTDRKTHRMKGNHTVLLTMFSSIKSNDRFCSDIAGLMVAACHYKLLC